MTKDVDATLTLARDSEAGTSLLLRHCLSLGTAEQRVPARCGSTRRSARSWPAGSSRA